MFSRSFAHRFHRQERESLSDDVSKGGDEEVEGGSGSGGDAAAAAAAAGKRPRGRPPGSKNKPKTPAADAAEPAPATAPPMRPHVLEIRAGHDVADALARFVRRRGIGICVLSAAGAVSDVTIRSGGVPQAAEGGAAVRLLGRLEILSVSGALLPPSSASGSASAAGLTVSLSGPQGQVLGGTVAGPMVAAEAVVVVAAAFSNPAVHRVPAEDDDDDAAAAAAAAPEEDRHHQRRGPAPPLSAAPVTSLGAAGESVYGAHFPPEVAWAPTARPPPPPPPHY